MCWQGTQGVGLRGNSGHTTCSSGVKSQVRALDASAQYRAREELTLGAAVGSPSQCIQTPRNSSDAAKTTDLRGSFSWVPAQCHCH